MQQVYVEFHISSRSIERHPTSSADVRKLRIAQLASLCHSLTTSDTTEVDPSESLDFPGRHCGRHHNP
jgi:hypothetical protein